MAKIRRTRNGLSAVTNKTVLRLAVLLGILLICLAAIVIKLVYLQIINAEDHYAAQVDQSLAEIETSSSRGDILDRNGNILVKDSSGKAIYIVPMNVRQADEDRVAKVLSKKLNKDYKRMKAITGLLEDDAVEVVSGISAEQKARIETKNLTGFEVKEGALLCYPIKIKDVEMAAAALIQIFEMDYDQAKEYITRKENQPIRIEMGVSNDLAKSIQDEIGYTDEDGVFHSNGLDLLDDHIRYYTNGTYLAHVLGFTNEAYHGAYGIEASCDEVLSGDAGVVLYQLDAQGNTIPSQTKVIQEATKGENVKLTIDINVQNTAEKLIKEAVEKYNASSGTAIVMKCKTAEILAIANYPSYDLNHPDTMPKDYATRRGSRMTNMTEDEKLFFMWKNPAVSLNYEPGSTFKAITASSALEEGVVSPDTTVYCDGGTYIDDIFINCTGNHGTQTVSEAVANSCNPGLVQIIQNLHPNLFYQYAYNFGYGQKTGIELDGEEKGLLTRVIENDGTWQNINYVTMSFGQGIGTTPIQNLAALNAVVNNGYYMKPTILSEDNVPALKRNGTSVATKQIISEKTSETMRNIMANVVQNLTNQSETYPIGGKTGTAEQFVNGSYSSYITSFFGFGPVEDPEYTVLVLLDGTDGTLTGSVTAAPVAINILEQLLSGTVTSSEEVIGDAMMPDLMGQSIDGAKAILEEKGIKYQVTQQDEGTTVISQSVDPNTPCSSDTEVTLVVGTGENGEMVTVPDLKGLSIQSCNQVLSGLSLKLKMEGSGFAVKQNPEAGTQVEKNTVVQVTFEP